MITDSDFFSAGGTNAWKLIDENHPLKLYVGKDDKGQCALEYVGVFRINKNLRSSRLIEVNHYSISSREISLTLSLTDDSCLKQFCSFCNDIVESTFKLSRNSQKGYEAICSLYFIWQTMFKSVNYIQSEKEIKGLIGELLFLKGFMIPSFGVSVAISSWTGSESSKKDFSVGNTWYEIKAISYGKPTVEISSLEQLESSVEGQLIVFQLEKMAPDYYGISLNKLISEILSQISSMSDKESFLEKLGKTGFKFSDLYDEYVYDLKERTSYNVDKEFPKIIRKDVNKAIAKVKYEIILSDINNYKL